MRTLQVVGFYVALAGILGAAAYVAVWAGVRAITRTSW